MRYAIFSDIHSNLEAFESVLTAYEKERIDKYLCVGDIVGYAADHKECIRKFQDLSSISVIGNHDAAVIDILDTQYFNPVAKVAVFWTKERLSSENKELLSSLRYVYRNEELILVHGTLNNPERFDYLLSRALAIETFRLMDRAICFIGHTHRPLILMKNQNDNETYGIDELKAKISSDKKYIINVGSVGQPRDGDPRAAYCVYDTDSGLLEIKRIEYNIKKAQEKIIQAGLPNFLAKRLAEGI